ncbi:hypothetical protein HDK90DRAFT_349551 [Phyllosticta capitalensis]|uniref:Secreted protein n=1 Tax=Phyllosticta capitalensis TaxID=121624 RepID=A0ABR1YHT7_9PEZI
MRKALHIFHGSALAALFMDLLRSVATGRRDENAVGLSALHALPKTFVVVGCYADGFRLFLQGFPPRFVSSRIGGLRCLCEGYSNLTQHRICVTAAASYSLLDH